MASVINKDTFNVLSLLGFKQAKPTNILVHPDELISMHVTPKKDEAGTYILDVTNITPGFGEYLIVRHKGHQYQFHVLRALAFLPLPESHKKLLGDDWTYSDLKEKKIVVNHKDGNKQNNAVDNIEWSTYRDNNIHAFQTGLRSDNYFGFCYDIVEDKEFEFYSINQLGRDLKIHADYISKYLKGPRTSLFQHRYMIRKVDEMDYPHYLTQDDMWRYSVAGISPLEVTNLETGAIMEFGSVAAATKALALNPIKKSLFRTKNDTKRIGHYEFKPVCDYDRIMKIKENHDRLKYEPINDNRAKRKPIPVNAKLKNGEILHFESRKEAAKHFGMTDTALKACLYCNEGKWRNIQFNYER